MTSRVSLLFYTTIKIAGLTLILDIFYYLSPPPLWLLWNSIKGVRINFTGAKNYRFYQQCPIKSTCQLHPPLPTGNLPLVRLFMVLSKYKLNIGYISPGVPE